MLVVLRPMHAKIAKKDMPRKVAVFDVDGTIFRSSLLIQLVERLIADGLFPADI